MLGLQYSAQAAGGFEERHLRRRIQLAYSKSSRQPGDAAADDGEAGRWEG
jgi:hypothetical protein